MNKITNKKTGHRSQNPGAKPRMTKPTFFTSLHNTDRLRPLIMPPKKTLLDLAATTAMRFGRVRNNLKMGVLGLPNVGKSSLFNLLTSQAVAAENYPFCTIEPNESFPFLPLPPPPFPPFLLLPPPSFPLIPSLLPPPSPFTVTASLVGTG